MKNISDQTKEKLIRRLKLELALEAYRIPGIGISMGVRKSNPILNDLSEAQEIINEIDSLDKEIAFIAGREGFNSSEELITEFMTVNEDLFKEDISKIQELVSKREETMPKVAKIINEIFEYDKTKEAIVVENGEYKHIVKAEV